MTLRVCRQSMLRLALALGAGVAAVGSHQRKLLDDTLAYDVYCNYGFW